MRVLFVDDEPRVLSGLRRMLRPRVREWTLLFAEGGQEALALAAAEPVDVVVSDMRMPGMTGAELLAEMRQLHPDTVRIILSGHSDVRTSVGSAQVAHQFLSKPCDPEVLKETVQRACALRDRLGSPVLRRLVGDLSVLPSPPQVVLDLNMLLESDDPSLEEVADLVRTDPAFAAKLLQMVNSAFFGLGQRLSSVRDAVGYLGMEVIRNLAVASSAFDAFFDHPDGRHFVAEEQSHALEVSSVACDLVPELPGMHDAFVAGLLHDVGSLVLALALPEDLRVARRTAQADGVGLCEAEREIFGTTHADIGAYLLSLWGLPDPILEAVARHHDAPSSPHRTLDVVHATYVANALASERHGDRWPGSRVDDPFDVDYLEELGITDRIEEIRRSRVVG